MANNMKKPLAAALGAAFLASAVAPAIADVNPFSANPMQSGYDLVNKADAEGKCGEGTCGAKKAEHEGKCAGAKAEDEGKCGGEKAKEKEKEKAQEGKCGEGKCGAQ